MRFFVLLSMSFLLTSCTQNDYKPLPQKAFQYSYQNPGRVLASPQFSKQLSSAKVGSRANVNLANNQRVTATLGHSYFSASGYQCRSFTIQSNAKYAACKIAGKWYKTSPIINNN